MRIDRAVDSMQRQGWVRLEEVQRTSKGFNLLFGVYKGQRGRRVGAWRIECSRVHEARITDWDGGGIAVYGSKHPAALQFAARQAEVRWTGHTDEDEPSTMAAVYQAHMETVDDWIDFDTYSNIQLKAKNMRAYRGPEFLIRAYAEALRSVGKHPKLILGRRRTRSMKLSVLHFGASRVVAAAFLAKVV